MYLDQQDIDDLDHIVLTNVFFHLFHIDTHKVNHNLEDQYNKIHFQDHTSLLFSLLEHPDKYLHSYSFVDQYQNRHI